MKKQWKGFLFGFLSALLVFGFAFPALAAYQKQVTLNYSGIKIMLNGKEFSPKDVNGNKAEPFIIDGTTYLPLRSIASACEIAASWDQSTQTVTLTDLSSTFTYFFHFSVPSFSNVVGGNALTGISDLGEKNCINYTYEKSKFTVNESFDYTSMYESMLIGYGFSKVILDNGTTGYLNPRSGISVSLIDSGNGLVSVLVIALPDTATNYLIEKNKLQ